MKADNKAIFAGASKASEAAAFLAALQSGCVSTVPATSSRLRCQKPPTAARNHRASFGYIASQEGTLIVRPSPRLQSRLFIGVGAPRKLLRCLPGLPTQAFVLQIAQEIDDRPKHG
jgi:hypothetical protein